jgi:hypothetical protein
MGVIEIYTKVNEQFNNPGVRVNPENVANDYRTPSVFNPTHGTSERNMKGRKPDMPATLYWNPDIRTNEEGKARISFRSSKSPAEITVWVEGISETELAGNAKIVFPVK